MHRICGQDVAEGIRLSEEHAETARGRTGIGRSAIRHEAGMLQDPHHRPGLQAGPGDQGEGSTRARCFPMSGKPGPEPLLRGAGAHRRVENSLHRIPDAAMNGGRLRSRTGRGAESPAVMRRQAGSMRRKPKRPDGMTGSP